MKKLILRTLRGLRNATGQFVSIVAIIAVGSAMFAGMFGAQTAMTNSVDSYYEQQNLADLWCYFKGISQTEIDALAANDDVYAAEGRYIYSAKLLVSNFESELLIRSVTNINSSLLSQGEYPQNANEIIVDNEYAKDNYLTLGDTLTLKTDSGGVDVIVTGFCYNPEAVVVQKDAAASASHREFGIAYATEETLIGLNRTTAIYLDMVNDLQQKLDDAKKELDDAEVQLADAQIEYENAKVDAETELDNALSALDDAKKKIDDGRTEFDKQKRDAEKQFTDLQAQINNAQIQLDESEQLLDTAFTEYQAMRSVLPPEQQEEQDTYFAAQYALLEQQKSALAAQQRQLNTKREQTQALSVEKETQLNDAQIAYDDGMREFLTKKADVETQLSDAEYEISDKLLMLSEKKAEFADGKAEAEAELEAAVIKYHEVLIKTDNPSSVKALISTNENHIASLERTEQLSYIMVDTSLDPLRSLSLVFPVIFFLVAAVIGFISISKTVETQRTQIAVMQAIGISKAKIRISFLSYSLVAAVLGSIGFAVIGNLLIPQYLIQAFATKLDMPSISVSVYPAYILLPLLIAFLFTGSAALLAVQKTLVEVPAQGMRPRPPKSAKETLLERWSFIWNRLNSSGRLICRGMLRNKARILLSSIGVIASAALLMTGFSLQNAATEVVRSIEDSACYDVLVSYDKAVDDKATLDFPYAVESVEMTAMKRAIIDLGTGVSIKAQFVESGSGFINVFDTHGNRLPIGVDSVLIPQNIAQDYGLSAGGIIDVEIGNVTYRLTITGISQQYLAKTLYISFDAAQAVGLEIEQTTALLKLQNPDNAELLADEIKSDGAVTGVTTLQGRIDETNSIMTMLNAVILVIILAAAALAITVIYNITSVNILERTREYATLMVLGRSKKQINKMISAENAVLMIIGCIVGLPLGYSLFSYLIGVISRGDMTLTNNLSLTALLCATGVSLLFVFLTNRLVRPKISGISLVETLKGIE